MDWKIELVAIPVTDVDRAKAFYVDQAGFNPDHDYQVSEALRFVQLTPPGSACSIVMGTGITQMPAGSQKGVQVVVTDVEAARRELIAHGVAASDVDVQPWGSFVTFSDPDGTPGRCSNCLSVRTRRPAATELRRARVRSQRQMSESGSRAGPHAYARSLARLQLIWTIGTRTGPGELARVSPDRLLRTVRVRDRPLLGR
jgi:catechol 2,3-dioxygenase-like lactoylglutathione lyase family enzyme